MLEPVHFTNLKKMALSPAHYRASVLEPAPMTAAMKFGSLVHHVFAGERVVVFDGERRGKVWTEFAAANDGAEVFTVKEHDKAKRCAEALHKNAMAVAALHGLMEHHISWEFLGRKCSSRLDVLGDGFITDLKTTNCAEPYRFTRAALGRFAYHGQLAFYSDAASFIGKPPRERYIVAVESAPPFAVSVFRLTPRAIEEGAKLCRLWFERLLGCEAVDEWPSYCQSIVDMDADSDTTLIIDGEELAA